VPTGAAAADRPQETLYALSEEISEQSHIQEQSYYLV
jgi:hypothetical protein